MLKETLNRFQSPFIGIRLRMGSMEGSHIFAENKPDTGTASFFDCTPGSFEQFFNISPSDVRSDRAREDCPSVLRCLLFI